MRSAQPGPARGNENKLILTLFADDTNIFLGANDDFDVTEEILGNWCTEAGAKFEIEKTEIIPVGSEEHRQR